uniref:Uncharacterized protein n=1 Tax=Aegilops tauschii subsp. strangulata TaxID=200361 RepID=A0A453JZ14_AEGTS
SNIGGHADGPSTRPLAQSLRPPVWTGPVRESQPLNGRFRKNAVPRNKSKSGSLSPGGAGVSLLLLRRRQGQTPLPTPLEPAPFNRSLGFPCSDARLGSFMAFSRIGS